MYLCCYVVKLAKTKKPIPRKRTTPKKVEVLPGIFNMTSYVCMCKVVFCGVSLVSFAFLVPNHYKNRFFEEFETRFSVLGVEKVGSTTWPPIGQ